MMTTWRIWNRVCDVVIKAVNHDLSMGVGARPFTHEVPIGGGGSDRAAG